MSGPWRRWAAAVVLALGAAAASPVVAITDEEIYRHLQIPSVAPGARAAAMGGASLALSDDAAASRINPARLTAIDDPELVVEAGFPSSDSGSRSSDLTRFDRSINPFAGSRYEGAFSADGGVNLGLLSYAHPLKLDRPLVLGISRTLGIDLSLTAQAKSRTTPVSAPVTPSGGDEVTRISRGRLDADMALYNLAAGWRITPTFSAGGALVVGRLDLSAESEGLLADPLQFTVIGMTDPRFTGTAPEPLARTISDGSDTAFAFSFGTYWKPLRTLGVAAVFRRGPRFEIPSHSEDLSAGGGSESFTNVVKVPDRAALGVAWTPFVRHPSTRLQSLTFTCDVERVQYEDLLEGLRTGEDVLTRSDFVRKVSYTIEDATEVHLGGEYRISFLTWTLAIRGGLYTLEDPALHLQHASGDSPGLEGESKALQSSGFLDGDDAQVRGTLGMGARFYSLSFDVAADVGEEAARVAASVSYLFR